MIGKNTLHKVVKSRIFCLQLLYCLLISGMSFSQTIQVNDVSPNPLCAGQSITVTFTATNGNGNPSYYDSNTVFSAYLSSSGGAALYSLIGNVIVSSYGFVSGNGQVNSGIQGVVQLPSNLSGIYKIAIASSQPTFNASSGLGASSDFTINMAPIGGVVTGGVTVCPGANNVLLSLSGYSGVIQKWQSSTVSDFSSYVLDIANTTTSYTVSNISVTTYYRAVTGNGICTANSSSTAVQVASGNTSANQSICFNTQPADISLSNYQGTSIQWQYSNDNVNFFDIPGANSAILTGASIGNLVETMYYRAIVSGSSCGTIVSGTITVLVSTASVGGSVSPSNVPAICPSDTVVLTLSGHTGSVIKWQSSTNQNFNNNVIDIFNTTTSLSVSNLSTTTYFRAVVVNGGCAGATSAKATVNVVNNGPAGGVLSPGNLSYCNSVNSTTLTLSGQNGTISKWQYSSVSDFSSGVTDVNNTTASLVVSNLSVTRYYRAVITKNTCTAYSSVATINVYPALSATIDGNNGPICSGSNAVFTLSGSAGAVVNYAINGGVAQAVVLTGGLATVTIFGVTVNQVMSLISVNSGVCTQSLSETSTVIVDNDNIWIGTAADNLWETAGNWSCNLVPVAGSNVIINSGTVVVSGINAFANALTLNGTASLTVNSGANITLVNSLNVASGASFVLQNNANLIQVNGVSNSGNIVVNRESSALMRLDYTLWSSPVASQNLLAFSPQTFTNRFYTYNSAANVYASIVPSSNSFQLGKGYLIRMPDNHPTTPTKWNGVFTGVPNNGNVNVSLYNGGAGFRYNAVGNPYPSPINLFSFVGTNNSNITGTLYFWRKTNNAATDPGYCTWTTAGFVNNGEAQAFDPNGVLRTGQGFLVEALGSANSLIFANSMRIPDNANQFFKEFSLTTGPLSGDRIWLNVNNSSGANNQMLVGYFNEATNGLDNTIDGIAIEDSPVSLTMDVDGNACLIQGRPTFSISDIVPLRLKTSYSGIHTIAIDHVDGVFAGTQNIFLKDNVLNTIHDLKSAAYNFTISSGIYPNRFELVYQGVTLNNSEPDLDSSVFMVYTDNEDVLVVESGKYLMSKIEIYDLQGRRYFEQNEVNSIQATISNLTRLNRVLFVKITCANNEIVYKKVVY